MRKKYFTLFACCIPVKGDKKSLICDLQRHTLYYINNHVYKIIGEFENSTYEEVLSENDDEKNAIEELVNFFIEKELGFFCDDISSFPKIKMEYKTPLLITNSIIDFDEDSFHDIKSITAQLSYLGCSDLQLRFHDPISLTKIDKVLTDVNKERLQSIELVIPCNHNSLKEFEKLISAHYIISQIIIYNSPKKDVNDFSNSLIVAYTGQLVPPLPE